MLHSRTVTFVYYEYAYDSEGALKDPLYGTVMGADMHGIVLICIFSLYPSFSTSIALVIILYRLGKGLFFVFMIIGLAITTNYPILLSHSLINFFFPSYSAFVPSYPHYIYWVSGLSIVLVMILYLSFIRYKVITSTILLVPAWSVYK